MPEVDLNTRVRNGEALKVGTLQLELATPMPTPMPTAAEAAAIDAAAKEAEATPEPTLEPTTSEEESVALDKNSGTSTSLLPAK